MILGLFFKMWISATAGVLFSLLFIGALAILSIALPQRGLQDRIAGTWPVPR
jgi:hypothetical protein